MIKTLDALNNARQLRVSEIDDLMLKEVYAVGYEGTKGTGEHKHLLFVEIVARPGSSGLRRGAYYSIQSACNSQPHSAIVVDQFDLKDICCSKCQKILKRIKENMRKAS